MYQRIATTHLATGGGINTINVLGEYNTALCRDGSAGNSQAEKTPGPSVGLFFLTSAPPLAYLCAIQRPAGMQEVNTPAPTEILAIEKRRTVLVHL